MEETSRSRRRGEDGSIMLEGIIRKYFGKMWTEIWIRIGSSDGLSWKR